jgi:hypothetical protein
MSERDATILLRAARQLRLLLLGLNMLLVAAITAAWDVAQFFQGYLFAWVLWAGPALGCAALLMIHHLTGGRWGWSVHRPLRCGVLLLPLIALFFVPLLFAVGRLYPWATEGFHAEQAIISFKPYYLQRWFFVLRSLLYLVIWAVGGWWLWRASVAERGYAPAIASAGLVIYVLTSTFAFYDWIATLEPHWYSTIYGMYSIIGQTLAALCLLIIVAATLPSVTGELSPDRFHELGNLLLALVVLWAYMAFSQFFIIWNSDLPEQIHWYLPRIHGFWGAVGLLLIIVHFFLPFAALLFRANKRNPTALFTVALVVISAHVLEVSWRILPSFADRGAATLISAFASTVGLGACVAAAFFWILRRTELPHEEPASSGWNA